MLTYLIEKTDDSTLTVKFGEDSLNDRKVVDALAQLDALKLDGSLAGGELIKINGPASLPVAMVIAHSLCHLYQAVACFVPAEKRYIVAIAHGGKYAVGDVIPL